MDNKRLDNVLTELENTAKYFKGYEQIYDSLVELKNNISENHSYIEELTDIVNTSNLKTEKEYTNISQKSEETLSNLKNNILEYNKTFENLINNLTLILKNEQEATRETLTENIGTLTSSVQNTTQEVNNALKKLLDLHQWLSKEISDKIEHFSLITKEFISSGLSSVISENKENIELLNNTTTHKLESIKIKIEQINESINLLPDLILEEIKECKIEINKSLNDINSQIKQLTNNVLDEKTNNAKRFVVNTIITSLIFIIVFMICLKVLGLI